MIRSRPTKVMTTSVGERGTLRTFAPTDISTLMSVPELEAKYRLLRNEWLTMRSRLKQAEERVMQTERTHPGKNSAVAQARENLAVVSTQAGVWRRLALLCRQRAEAEVYREVCEQLLPAELKKALTAAVEETLMRPIGDMGRDQAAKPEAKDYAMLDEMLRRWGPLFEDAA